MTDAYAYIRFSTAAQEMGDSRRRQAEHIHRFVSANNLILHDSHRFYDEGVSGYRGDNLRQGLGRFIEELDAGKISRGSYLIVESVDRLSRQSLVSSFGLLLSLVGKGIKLVTLNDAGVQIIDESAGLQQFLVTLVAMDLAYKESQKKSFRVQAAWKHKKANAATEKVTSRCPEWLVLNKDSNQFEPIPDRVTTVQKIFELADEGIGRHRIVRYLNSNGYKSFRNAANGWQPSSVAKLLRNRALIGYYQPCSVKHDPETGKETRAPDGEEVANYYPVVIDESLFRRVASRAFTRAMPLRGRQGPELTNLFTGLAYCQWCGASMSLSNKGKPPKGGRYLVCSNARRGNGCVYRAWKYEEFETLVLVKMRELDLASVMGNTTLTQELNTVRNNIVGITDQLSECQKLLAGFQETVNEYEGRLPRALLERWRAEEAREAELQTALEGMRAREQGVTQRVQDPASFGQQLIELYDTMDNLPEQERYLVRVRLRERLAILIERISVRALKKDEPRVIRGVPRDRLVQLHFRNGQVRTIVPIGENDVFSIDTSKKLGGDERI